MRRLAIVVLAAAGFGLAALTVQQRAGPDRPPVATRAQVALPRALADSAFGRLIERLSEPGGYFDTDNLISNESSYLHVVGRLRQLGATGGAYIGVGPDQNFSYIAAIRPSIAFIVDIRRDNLLQHLVFKALFEAAPTRIEYLCLLFGRQPPAATADWDNRPIAELIDWIERTPPDRSLFEETRRRVAGRVTDFGYPLSDSDLDAMARIQAAFFKAGPGLRSSSHGRLPRASYPTYGQLLLETDREGRQASFLAEETGYQFVRELERRNLVIPVTGDFAGDHALREIASILHDRGETVTAFYLSNVEFYLWQDRTFGRFARNVAALPFTDRSVMIRSLFGRVYGHPQSVPGYNSTQLLQGMAGFVRSFEAGAYRTYDDLVYGDYIDLRS